MKLITKAHRQVHLALAMALLTLGLLISPVQAGSISHETVTVAMASWEDEDVWETGTGTIVFIATGEVTSQNPPGNPSTMTMLDIQILQIVDWVPSIDISESVPIPDTAISIDRKLSTATLDVEVEVTDWSDWMNPTTLTITIHVDWTGVGSTTKTHSNYHYKADDVIMNYHYSAVHRDAAADGAISGDLSIDLGALPLAYASLESGKMSMIEVS